MKLNIIIPIILVIFLISGCSQKDKVGPSPVGEEVLETPFNPPEVKEYFVIKESQIPENLMFFKKISGDEKVHVEDIRYTTGETGYKIYFCKDQKFIQINKELSISALANKWKMTALYITPKYSACELKENDQEAIILTLKKPNNRSCTIIQTK